jgi:hypothetical protein
VLLRGWCSVVSFLTGDGDDEDDGDGEVGDC